MLCFRPFGSAPLASFGRACARPTAIEVRRDLSDDGIDDKLREQYLKVERREETWGRQSTNRGGRRRPLGAPAVATRSRSSALMVCRVHSACLTSVASRSDAAAAIGP